MNRIECGSRNCFKFSVLFILLNALMFTGCATLGDIESANQNTQASVNSLKKESRERDNEMAKEIRSLSKDIQSLQNKGQGVNQQYEKIIKENAELRASILEVTGTIQAFLSAEKKRYEEGLRWIDNAKKTVGKETADLSVPIPQPKPAPAESPAPAPQAAVAVPAPVPEKSSTDSKVTEKPIINILEIEIDPPEVTRNSNFKVTVKYDLQINPESPKLQYLEEIVLLKGTMSIKNLKDTVERAPGTIFYSQTIDVPAEAPLGVYTIKGMVSSGSVRDSKIKTFMVK